MQAIWGAQHDVCDATLRFIPAQIPLILRHLTPPRLCATFCIALPTALQLQIAVAGYMAGAMGCWEHTIEHALH